MALADYYPEPDALIKSELHVLNFLRNSPYIVERQSQFAQDAIRCYERFKNDRTGFEFSSYFSVRHAQLSSNPARDARRSKVQPNVHLIVGAQILLADSQLYGNVTHCFAVCRIRSRRPSILRKFHFDVAVENPDSIRKRQPHPRFHLQYCGKMLPCMSALGCHNEQLEQMHPGLSEPRIFFWPMSLALLIDMALCEFPDQWSVKLRDADEWREIVRTHEKLLLGPFYQRCADVIADKHSRKRTLADEFYVT